MKKALYILFLAGSAASAQSGSNPAGGNTMSVTINPAPRAAVTATTSPTAPEITFTETAYWFGKLKKGAPVTHKFQYKNTGKEPLVIYECKTGCVCMTATCSKGPLAPGETGFIEAHYDSTHIGPFAKDIFIKSNAKNGMVNLIIRGVIEDMAEPTGEKAPVKNE